MSVAIRQGSPEWIAARRDLVTATDLGVLLGVNPWRSEADLAAEKRGERDTESTLRMRVGLALEPLVAAEYEAQAGVRLRRFHGLHVHPSIDWAAASPDYRVEGRRKLVETKWTAGRARFADGLPQDVEAQARWQLGVLGWQEAEVAVLIGGEELRRFPVEHDPETFASLVAIAADFRRRLAAGGPFAESSESLRLRYPQDDGSEITADAELEEAARELQRLRTAGREIDAAAGAIEVAIKTRMADASRLVGNGWQITWRRTRDIRMTDWESLADGLLAQLPEEQRTALVGIHTNVRPGARPFRLTWKETPE